MRGFFGLLFVLSSVAAYSQAPPDPTAFRNGVAYTFERKFATREVRDALDQGRISLATYIFRPIKSRRNDVVLFTHGSMGGMSVDPHEPLVWMPTTLTQYFVRKGYTVVYSTRRGIGESTGTFVEECPFASGKCTLEEYRELAEPGIFQAEADTDAVIDQIILGHEVTKDSKLLFAGISRGGLLALRMASRRPKIAAGVVNFVGGWLSVTNTWDAQENTARVELQQRLFKDIGAGFKGIPSLWIYASRDPFYSEVTTRSFFAAFQSAGGSGEYFFVPDHNLRIGHIVATEPALWATKLDSFIASLSVSDLSH